MIAIRNVLSEERIRDKEAFLQILAEDPILDPRRDPETLEIYCHGRTRAKMRLASLSFAKGASSGDVMRMFGRAAREWKQLLPKLVFNKRDESRVGNLAWTERLKQRVSGVKVTKVGRNFQARFTTVAQPLVKEFLQDGLVSAAISGEKKLAELLAREYPLAPLFDYSAHAVLRHILAGDQKRARQACAFVTAKYPRGQPPCLVQFPRAILERDEGLIISGLKQIKSRFARHWDIQKWTADKDYGSEDWILSLDTIAFLRAATWQGMELPDRLGLYSEWAPLSLCE